MKFLILVSVLLLLLGKAEAKISGSKPTDKHSSFVWVQFTDAHVGFTWDYYISHHDVTNPLIIECLQNASQNRNDEFLKTMKEIRNLHPDFVVDTGDLVRTPSEEEYRKYMDMVAQIEAPVYFVIGNADDNYGKSPSDYANLWKEATGYDSTYYSFDWKGYHFIVLDTVKPGHHSGTLSVPSGQLSWLKKDLSQVGSEKPIIIVMHHPADGPAGDIDDYGDLHRIFEGYNVKAFYAGHYHEGRRVEFTDNTCFIISNAVLLSYSYTYKPGYRINSINGDAMWTTWVNSEGPEPIINKNHIDEKNEWYVDESGERATATVVGEGKKLSRNVSFLPGTVKKAVLEIKYTQEAINSQPYRQKSNVYVGNTQVGEFQDSQRWTKVLLPISESMMFDALSQGSGDKITLTISNPSSNRRLWIDWIDLGESTVEWRSLYPH